MQSKILEVGRIELPLVTGEHPMIPFYLASLKGIPEEFKSVAADMLSRLPVFSGIGYFTIHGRSLSKGQTLRRGGPHTDGNYEPHEMDFGSGGGNGWKVGENGPPVGSEIHKRQYVKPTGGIIMASNYEACLGWQGEYDGEPGVGGDCSHIKLDSPFQLNRDTVYYGNNHFIHESLPMAEDVHRVFARITMPEDHKYAVA